MYCTRELCKNSVQFIMVAVLREMLLSANMIYVLFSFLCNIGGSLIEKVEENMFMPEGGGAFGNEGNIFCIHRLGVAWPQSKAKKDFNLISAVLYV